MFKSKECGGEKATVEAAVLKLPFLYAIPLCNTRSTCGSFSSRRGSDSALARLEHPLVISFARETSLVCSEGPRVVEVARCASPTAPRLGAASLDRSSVTIFPPGNRDADHWHCAPPSNAGRLSFV